MMVFIFIERLWVEILGKQMYLIKYFMQMPKFIVCTDYLDIRTEESYVICGYNTRNKILYL